MKNVSFVMTPEEVQKFKKGGYMSKGARLDGFEGLYVSWATNPEAAKEIMPPPLQVALPVATAYIAYVGNANYALPYMEAGIAVPAVYDGVVGFYYINFQLTGDGAQMATFLGRESGGIPKKFADNIRLNRMGDSINAYVERDGIRLIDIAAEIGEYNSPEAKELFAGMVPGTTVPGNNYLFKFDLEQDPDGTTNLRNTRLRRSSSQTAVKEWLPANARVTLMPSENDPWAALPVLKVLGAGYTKCDMHLAANQDVAEVDVNKVLPYLMKGRFDTVYLGKANAKFR